MPLNFVNRYQRDNTVDLRGGFSFTIDSEALSKGLRKSKRLPRDSKRLVTCNGLIGRDGVLQSIDELTRIDTSIYTLAFDAQTGSFTVGNTITGATSSATGIVIEVSQNGGAGTLYLGDVSGTFQDDEVIYEGIGSDLVTDGGFVAVTDDVGEMSSGLLTIGDCYLISARTDGDFQAVGSPNDNVGAYFIATGTGVGLLDAGDKVFPVTFDSWTEGTGWAPEAVGGSLTNKANFVAGTSSNFIQTAVATIGKAHRIKYTVSNRTAGAITPRLGTTGRGATQRADGTYYDYVIANSTALTFAATAPFDGTIDDAEVRQIISIALANGTATLVDSFPYPQIFVFTNVIIVCGETKIYEWNGSALVHKLTVTAGSTWDAEDFYDFVYMSNGKVAVVRNAGDKTYAVVTDLPTASTICNFNGQVLIGAPDVEP